MEEWITMRIFLAVLLALGLVACSDVGNKNEDEPTSDENVPEEKPGENENTSEEEGSKEGDSNGDVEEVPEEKTPQNVLNETKAQVVSDFDIKLPSDIAVSDGKYLSAMVDSDNSYYAVTYYETNEPTAINDAKLTQQDPVMLVKGTVYHSEGEANEQVGYQPIQEGMPEIDLGHGITGYQDAGAGSSFITWHEGRWSFIMRSQNDETGIAAGKQLAKEIVEKLEKGTLPPPHENGSGILSSGDNDDVETNRLAWQEKNIVYEVYMADALQLIDVVTSDFK